MLEINEWIKYVVVFFLIIFISYVLVHSIDIPSHSYGYAIKSAWFNLTQTPIDLNDPVLEFKQFVSLASFLLVVAFMLISMKLRSFIAFAAVCLLVFLGAVEPQFLIRGVEWSLILFLVGTMSFAFILRSIGVFEYVGLKLLEATYKHSFLLLFSIALLSWFLAMVLDEVTSIVYVSMLIFDIRKLTGFDVKPLIIVSVLATNTGSLALPVGNPIGIYLSYTAKLTVREFILKALPVSTVAFLVIISLSYVFLKKYIDNLSLSVSSDKFIRKVQLYYIEKLSRDPRHLVIVKIGILLVFGFLVAILLNEYVCLVLSRIFMDNIDPHYTLSFIPYLFLTLSGIIYGPTKLERAVESGVDWPSILFFISLFMLGFSLLHTGVSFKIAYLALEYFGGSSSRLSYILLILSGGLSSVLDNLSVVVAFSYIAKVVVAITGYNKFYWSILYGGVLGGNLTPIGSTANIVAIGLASREKIEFPLLYWLKYAIPVVFVQLILSLLYLTIL
ncbi:MAG: SLC13 family permease [Desulfurococcaceae archaeon]